MTLQSARRRADMVAMEHTNAKRLLSIVFLATTFAVFASMAFVWVR